jgi:hypothetical protein
MTPRCGCGKPDHIERADEIDAERARKTLQPVRSVAADHLFGRRDTGAIHQSAQAPESFHRSGDHRRSFLTIAHIGLDEANLAAELPGDLFARFLIEIGDRHAPSCFDEHARCCGTEPRAAAGDDET